jgi:hypothetical protein
VGKSGETTGTQAVHVCWFGEAPRGQRYVNFLLSLHPRHTTEPPNEAWEYCRHERVKSQNRQAAQCEDGGSVDLDDRVAFIDERASIYHIIKQKKCREQRTIMRLLDQADRTQMTNKEDRSVS